MPTLAITIEGRESVLDTDNLMLSELEVLEEHAGIDLATLGNVESLKSMRMIGHLLWLLKLRELAAEKSVPITKAAVLLPRDGFDVAVGGIAVRTITGPKDPSPSTRTTRSRPPASKSPRARSAKSAAPKSGGSPKS